MSLTRRRCLVIAGLGASGLWVGAAPSLAQPLHRFTTADRALTLRLSRIGAVFPFAFPAFGEAGKARTRCSDVRMRDALARTDDARAQQAHRGVRRLRHAGAGGMSDADLVAALAEAASSSAADRDDLIALTAIGIATASKHFSPNADSAARMWVDVLVRMNDRGTLASEVSRAGV